MDKQKKYSTFIRIGITIIVISLLWGCEKDSAPTTVTFETIDQGSNSGIVRQSVETITNQSDWQALWAEHTKITDPAPELPVVDFDQEMVIAAFDGQWPTGGFSTEITGIEETPEKIVVSVLSTSPAGGTTIQILTQPFHIVRTELSPKPVEIQRTSE